MQTQTWGGMTFLVHASCGGSMNASQYGIDGCWWGLRLKPQAYNRFTAGDTRAATFFTNGQTVAVTSIGDFDDRHPNAKYKNVTSTGAPGSHPTHVDTDFPMFRLADAYLIYAEAHLRGGGGSAAQALTYVNALRQRAYGNANGNITGAQLTLDFILDERGRELLWEGHRRTDLVRYGRFTGGATSGRGRAAPRQEAATECVPEPVPDPVQRALGEPQPDAEPGVLTSGAKAPRRQRRWRSGAVHSARQDG